MDLDGHSVSGNQAGLSGELAGIDGGGPSFEPRVVRASLGRHEQDGLTPRGPFAGRGLPAHLSPDVRKGSGTDINSLVHAVETLGERAGQATADYGGQTVADWLLPDRSVSGPGQAYLLAQTAISIDTVSELLQSAATAALKEIGRWVGLAPGAAAVGGGICTNLVLAPITGPLERASTFLEAAGLAVGLMTGALPLVLACVKLLAHKEVEHLVSEGSVDLIPGPHTGDATLNVSSAAMRYGQPLAMRHGQPSVGYEQVISTTSFAPPIPVMKHSAAKPQVEVRVRDGAAAAPLEALRQDGLWLCLGFAPGRPAPAEASKVIVRTKGDDDVADTVHGVLGRSSSRKVDAPTATAIGDLPAGTHLVLRMGGIGLGTFTTKGSKGTYQHPGCLTGRCVPPGRPPCLCPCSVCRR